MLVALSAGAASSAPEVSGVQAASPTVGLYEKFELTFNVSTVSTRLYWPHDEHPNGGVPAGVGVSVDGLFSNDDWQTIIVQPAFYYTDFDYHDRESSGGHHDWLYPVGSPVWKIRFAPTALGQWQYRIRVTDSVGTTTFQDRSSVLTCVPSQSRGFVRVSASDPRYFETSDGAYLNLIGLTKSAGVIASKEGVFSIYGKNGVNLVRSWWQASSGPVLFGLSGQGGLTGWTGPYKIASDAVREGELFSGMITGTGTATAQADVKPSTRYEFSAWVKTVGVVGAAGCGVRLQAYDCVEGDVALSQIISGDSDWTQISGTFTTEANESVVNWLKVVVKDVDSGATYFTDMSLREILPAGGLGPELLSVPNLNKQQYVSQREAWLADREVDMARANGIYLKIVLEEKKDVVFRSIQADGTAGPPSEANVYATDTHASRTYQQYYWRYIIARYGYSTSIHSFEFCNEGDPFSGGHTSALEAMSAYFANNDPNKHLCSTSNWHSYPTAEMWEKAPGAGYTDWHQYNGKVSREPLSYMFGWDNHLDGCLDDTTYHSAACSAHISGDAADVQIDSLPIPVVGGHKYAFRWFVKGDVKTNSAHPISWQFPTVYVQFKTGWRGYNTGPLNQPADPAKLIGQFDWTERSFTVIAPDGAHYVVISPSLHWLTGEVWFDDITMRDETTGLDIEVPNGSFDANMRSRMDYDTALMTYSVGMQIGPGDRREIKKPTIRGEVGISGEKLADRIVSGGYTYHWTGENQELIQDTEGVWYRKFVWGQINPFGVTDIYWWQDNIRQKNLFVYVKAYQSFMADVPLSNGNYQDALAVTSSPSLRAWGQKDVANSRAHLWIDNAPYTWKNVVDQVDVPPVSGTVVLSGLADGPHQVEWWDTSAGTITKTGQLMCSGGRIVLRVTGLKSDVACKIQPSPGRIEIRLTTSIPNPASGEVVTVTVGYAYSGRTDALNASVTARVPAQMEYVPGSAESSGGVYDPQSTSITWTVPRIPPAGTGTRVFQAKVQ